MPPPNDRSDRPALQIAARLPAYTVLALMIVAVSAGGLLAARGEAADPTPTLVADVVESELPTPIPPSETPLPTPIPVDQSVIVDTAVAFWVEFIPEELLIEFQEAIMAASSVPSLHSAPAVGSASPGPTPEVAKPSPASPSDTPVPSVSTMTAPLPLPPDVSTPVPLPEASDAPLPSELLPLATPTLPPLLP